MSHSRHGHVLLVVCLTPAVLAMAGLGAFRSATGMLDGARRSMGDVLAQAPHTLPAVPPELRRRIESLCPRPAPVLGPVHPRKQWDV